MEECQLERKCPKCTGTMAIGFLRDRSRGNLSEPAEWMEGVPERNWLGVLKLSTHARYTVKAFRCEQCGFLEQYAVGVRKTGSL